MFSGTEPAPSALTFLHGRSLRRLSAASDEMLYITLAPWGRHSRHTADIMSRVFDGKRRGDRFYLAMCAELVLDVRAHEHGSSCRSGVEIRLRVHRRPGLNVPSYWSGQSTMQKSARSDGTRAKTRDYIRDCQVCNCR